MTGIIAAITAIIAKVAGPLSEEQTKDGQHTEWGLFVRRAFVATAFTAFAILTVVAFVASGPSLTSWR
jgi:hypothetical protein